jgi:phosphatidyl-myo-inositol alpha-mannosyltransferase
MVTASAMNIAFFSKQLPSDAPNGVSCQVHRLANALVKKGERVTCFSFSPAPSDALYTHIKLDYGTTNKFLKKFMPALLFHDIDPAPYDILHYHGDDFLCKGSLKRVRTFYGTAFWEACFAKTISRFFYQAVFFIFELVSALRRGAKVGISRSTGAALPMIRTVIPCCVPLERYKPGIKKTTFPSLLFIGDLDSRKNGRFLLKTFIRDIHPLFPEAVLTVVGPQQETNGDGVRFIGQVNEDSLIGEYQTSWIYCSVSSYEGFGVPLIEAMACGVAIIALENGGSREIINHEYNGLLCIKNDFNKNLVRLLNEQTFRGFLVANALSAVIPYEAGKIAEQYKALYSCCRGGCHEK